MATTVARLEAVLSANTRDFDRAMDKSQGKMHQVGRVAGVAGAAIAGGLVFGLERSVKAALHAQTSQNRLEQSFKNAHIALTPYTKAIEEAESAGRKLGFTDEATKTALGSLITATGSYEKAAKELSVAQDVARFKGVELTDATKMLTMAQTGSQRAAKQLGITVPAISAAYDALGKNATAVEKAQARMTDKMATGDAVIQAVREHVAGQADAYSKTASGGMEQFRAQLDHLEVSMGQGLLPILAQVAAALARGTEFFSKHRTAAKALTVALGALAAALLAAKIQQIALNLAILANPYVAAAVAVAALSAALVILWRRYEAARIAIQAVVVITGGALIVAIYQAIKNWGALTSAMQPAINAIHGINSALQRTVHWLQSAVGWVKDLISWLGKIHIPDIPFVGGGGGKAGGKALTSNDKHMLSNTVPQVQNAVEVARENGWAGSITSGYRSYAQQAALYQRYLNGGPLAAKPGTSSHERGQAVDVTSYGNFGSIMARTTPAARLYNRLGSADPVHYSVTGYAKGGLITKPTNALMGEAGPEVVTPLSGLRGGTWQQKYYDFMQRVWRFARPYFPNALGPMPPVTFTQGIDSLFVGTDFTPDDQGNIPPPGKRRLYWPKWLSFFSNRNKAVAAYETLIHEWAHSFQDVKQTQGIRLGEGGAEAFAEKYTPAIYRGLGFHIQPGEVRGIMGNYFPYVKWVEAHKGAKWIDKTQFGVFDKGGWLQPGLTMAYNGTGKPERVGGDNIVIPVSIGGEHVATVIFDQLRRKAKVFENRNGRPAFGGA